MGHHHHPSSHGSQLVTSEKTALPNSPCFVHSNLDSSLVSTSRAPIKRDAIIPRSSPLFYPGSSSTLSPKTPRPQNSNHYLVPEDEEEEEYCENDPVEDEEPENLSQQLAETATSVREMSKELGRTRIKSSIQSILIITKARDNKLIRLTREVALWLISQSDTPSETSEGNSSIPPLTTPDRPLVVYVDHQLRSSSRFDREGMERDHPQWFRPLASRHPFYRRESNSTSASSLVSAGSSSNSATSVSDSSSEKGQLRFWTAEMCAKSPELFDLVITLGGDGTVLFASWLFQHVVPPIVPFALGSLGFLTNFDYSNHQQVLRDAKHNGVRVNLRMRFSCTVYRASVRSSRRRAIRSSRTGEIFMNAVGRSGWEAIENGLARRYTKPNVEKDDKEIVCFSTHPAESFEVLNELVVDRGPSPYVSQLELFGDEHHMTTVQADGLTVSTPTGSTAYSLSAGGSLVHPEIPALLITPICPHTLSFRPMLLPDTMELRICVPYTSRSTAWASFDGRGRVELRQGDHIKVTASAYPFPTVCAENQSKDWFHAISRTLKWNERERQKSFVVVEEERKNKSATKCRDKIKLPSDSLERATDIRGINCRENEEDSEEDEEDDNDFEDGEEEEEDEVFDIDDLPQEKINGINMSAEKQSFGINRDSHYTQNLSASSSRRGSPSDFRLQLGEIRGGGTAFQDHESLSTVKTFTVRGLDASSSSEGSF
ncbi:ATP-NAD kinase-like domain-containing protein [Phakopsora pachyrhizi]|uniref:ATP-NAD kinase-like domain-containing protein n=1 Tax=Phakopsora pachyrhizi TaxID=170000 RepID=A0AAV0BT76_PHAPC|nr:ATP-NAD kinase-like domain-containing protein [Phakopsora pachyrhizi]KAI8458140.1 ATP-NAD kinase-like domain-containing protein [Phakopsora pachyrhizi]CAH7678722.1 ATP-NAD kinase-like domain-containing protein [Phakopsora pachyrhizi]CAH7690727.1 ATP-NAD kinase-like domain-containing protein [Phakopsora pachyrhizi]